MASWARVAGACAQATRGLLRQEGQLARAVQQGGQQSRGFAAGGGHGHGVTYEGVTIPKAATWHVVTGKAFASVMWFWVFYRLYNDWDHFVYGPAAHLEHEIAHEEEHGDAHEEEHGNAHSDEH